MSKPVFADFAEYWSFAKHFSNKQRRVILKSLPKSQQQMLEDSYVKSGLKDLFIRNELDAILDSIRDEYGVDLLRLRVLVLGGKTVHVNKKFWDHILTNEGFFKGYTTKRMERHVHYIFGGYRATESEHSPDEYRLVPMEGR